MRGTRRMLVAALAAVLILTACGGDDPTATPPPEPTATSTIAPAPVEASPSATATATSSAPAATATQAPTANRTATPPLPTPRPIATPTPTAEPTATPDPLAEAGDLLLEALLDERSLPEGWTRDSTDVRFEADPEQQTVCDLHEFPGRAELVMEAEAEFSSADGSQFFQQSIAEYPMLTAMQAMNFARIQIDACSEWQSPDGIVFTVEPVQMPLPTGDGQAYSLRFALDEQQFEGRWTFVRVNSFVTTIVYFAPEGTDLAPLALAIFDAKPRLEIVLNELFEPGSYDDLALASFTAMQLMGHGEVRQLPEMWGEFGVTHAEGEQRYNVCGLDLFTERFGALEELQNEFVVDRDSGPFLWQSISTFPDEQAAMDAMSYIRDTVSCAEFPDNTGYIWQVLEYPEMGFGDEAHAAIMAIDDEEAGTAQGEFVFVRVGEQITVIVYVVVGEALDHGRVAGITETAVREIERLRR